MKINLIVKNSDGAIVFITSFLGDVKINTKIDYMQRTKHPFIPNHEYRWNRYFEDIIEVSIAANDLDTQRLRNILAIPNHNAYLQWQKGHYLYTRLIDVTELPTPVSLFQQQTIECKSVYQTEPEPFNIEKLTKIHTPSVYRTIIGG